MRNFNNIVFNSILCGMVIALFQLAFAPFCWADMESDAKRELENMSAIQIADPDALDHFIKKYPNTEQARIVFTYRYTLLTSAPSIDDYNKFIKQYSDKDIVPFAIHDVYKLYCEQNRASGYYDFISRYPGSQQAIVATERLQQLFFEYVCLLNKVDDYDSFISLFPDAPQVEAAKIKAGKLAGDIEEKEFAAFKNVNPTPSAEDIEKYVTAKIVKFDREVNLFTTKYPNISNDTMSEDRVDIMLRLIKIQRQSLALQRVYKNYPQVLNVQRTINELKILTRLDAIFNAIEKNHKELLAKLDEETDRICDGLALLHQDNMRMIEEMRNGFKALHQDLINIHQELKDINVELVKVNANLEQLRKDVNANFDRLDKKLDVINQNLINIQTAVTQSALATNQVLREEFSNMNKNIETGFNRQAVMLERVNQTMVNGFNETNQRLFGIGQQIDKLDKDMIDGFGHVQSSLGAIGNKLDNIDNNMRAGFSAISNQLNELDDHLVTGLNAVGNKIDNMDAHMQAGMNALNNNINAMHQDMNAGFNRVCDTVYEAADSVNKSLNVLHHDMKAVNENVIAGNQMIGNMHRDMVNGFNYQAQLSREILYQNEIQNDRLNEIKNVAYSGFNNLNRKMDSQIALQRSGNAMLSAMNAAQQSMGAFQRAGLNINDILNKSGKLSNLTDMMKRFKGKLPFDLSKITGGNGSGGFDKGQLLGDLAGAFTSSGSKTKAISNAAGTAAAAVTAVYFPAAAPVVKAVAPTVIEKGLREGKRGWNKLRKKLFGSAEGFEYYDFEELSTEMASVSDNESINLSFKESNYRVLFAAYNDVDEDAVEIKQALMKMIFQEDKRRVLYAAMQLASFKRPYPVFPKNLEDLVLNAKNADELRDAILPLAVYCDVTPEALTFAAQYIF